MSDAIAVNIVKPLINKLNSQTKGKRQQILVKVTRANKRLVF